MKDRFKKWLANLLGFYTATEFDDFGNVRYIAGYDTGRMSARTQYSVLPLPFTSQQLSGADYGTFVSPAGFGLKDGICPAPGTHGYEQRFYYANRKALNESTLTPLVLVSSQLYTNPEDDTELVPVILTVLR